MVGVWFGVPVRVFIRVRVGVEVRFGMKVIVELWG